MTINKILLPLLMVLLLASCAQNETGAEQIDYEETKKMVVDILKTDDGKKALQEVMADEKMKQELVMEQAVVSETIQTTLTSDKGLDFWKKSFEDPKFAESIAKSMKKENEQLLKDLMKDPEYRGMMIEVLKDPELEKEAMNILKSKEYREHVQSVVTEVLESPLFKAKMTETLLKAAEEEAKAKEGKKKEEGGEE